MITTRWDNGKLILEGTHEELTNFREVLAKQDGGPGSGNFGHSGVPGQQGGSGAGSGSSEGATGGLSKGSLNAAKGFDIQHKVKSANLSLGTTQGGAETVFKTGSSTEEARGKAQTLFNKIQSEHSGVETGKNGATRQTNAIKFTGKNGKKLFGHNRIRKRIWTLRFRFGKEVTNEYT